MSIPSSTRQTKRALLVFGIPVLFLGALASLASCASAPTDNVLTDNLSETLKGATVARVDINCGPGHLTVERLADDGMLASGKLEYLEKQGVPARTTDLNNGQATLTLKPGSAVKPGFRFPWQASWGGAYNWQINLNPSVTTDITAHSDGGNMKLNLADMTVTRLFADNDGGNVEVALPDKAANLSATAKTGGGSVTVDVGGSITGRNTLNATSGAGNVLVRIPAGMAAHIHATSGLGKVIVDPSFTKIDKDTYQSTGYNDSADKVEITVSSGAGNASITIK